MDRLLSHSFSGKKLRKSLKTAVVRIKIHVNIKSGSISSSKRALLGVFLDGKNSSGKAKVMAEYIIRDEAIRDGLEFVELLCNLLHARSKLVATSKRCCPPPPDIKEIVASLIWAAPRCDIDELDEARHQLSLKYGREFLGAVDKHVNPRLFQKLSLTSPTADEVEAYLEKFAQDNEISTKTATDESGDGSTPPSVQVPVPSAADTKPSSQIDNIGPHVGSTQGAGQAPSCIPPPMLTSIDISSYGPAAGPAYISPAYVSAPGYIPAYGPAPTLSLPAYGPLSGHPYVPPPYRHPHAVHSRVLVMPRQVRPHGCHFTEQKADDSGWEGYYKVADQQPYLNPVETTRTESGASAGTGVVAGSAAEANGYLGNRDEVRAAEELARRLATLRS